MSTQVRGPVKVAQVTPIKKMDYENGHSIILKGYISQRSIIEIVLNTGLSVFGRVTQFDNHTITINKTPVELHHFKEEGLETFYKHSISSFRPFAK